MNTTKPIIEQVQLITADVDKCRKESLSTVVAELLLSNHNYNTTYQQGLDGVALQ